MLYNLFFFFFFKIEEKNLYNYFKNLSFKQNIGCIILYSSPDPIEYFKPYPRLSRLPKTSDRLILCVPVESEISWQ